MRPASQATDFLLPRMPGDPGYRSLALPDVERAAQVVSEAFLDDPLCAFILPLRRTRGKTLRTFFRAYGEVNIKNGRGFGVGDPLQGMAYWRFPDQLGLSISLKPLGKFIPLLFTFYPIGIFRARAVLRQIDALHEKHASEPHFYLDNLAVLPSPAGPSHS